MILFYFHTILYIIMDLCCCLLFFEIFAKKRTDKRIFTIGPVCILGILYFIISYALEEHFYIRCMSTFITASTTFFLIFRISYSKVLALTTCYLGMDYMTEYVIIIILDRIFPLITDTLLDLTDAFHLLVHAAFCKLLLLGIILLIWKLIGRKTLEVLTGREYWILFTISLITIFSLAAIVVEVDLLHNTNQSNSFFYLLLGMLFLNFIVFYLINVIMEREMNLRENAIFREKVKSETSMYHSISENLEKQQKRTHEYKNQIAAIRALAEGEQYEKLKEYIKILDDKLKCNPDAVDTNNVIVNAILNTKYREAVSKGIVFVLKVNDLSKLNIEEEHIVVILSNLLNNALEACEQCKDKFIKLKFVLEEEQIVISIKNSIETVPIVKEGTFLTTKGGDTSDHGIGIQNVIETVERYSGRYVIDYDKESFQFSILIPNHSK